MKSRYEAVLFDWDGCLFNSLPIWLAACQSAFIENELSVPRDQIATRILPDLDTSVEYGITDLSRFISRVLTLVNESISNGEFHGGALALLQLLQSAEVPYAVVSSSSREMILKGAARHACDSLLPHLVTRHDVTKTKPDPEPLLKALSLLNAKPDRAVMIGDNSVDVLAGQALGMDTILYHPATHSDYYDRLGLESFQPTWILNDWSELAQILFGDLP